MNQEDKHNISNQDDMSILKAYLYLFKPKELDSLRFSNSELKLIVRKWLRVTSYLLIFGLFVLFLLYQKLKKADTADDFESISNGILGTQMLMIVSLIVLFLGISNLLNFLKP